MRTTLQVGLGILTLHAGDSTFDEDGANAQVYAAYIAKQCIGFNGSSSVSKQPLAVLASIPKQFMGCDDGRVGRPNTKAHVGPNVESNSGMDQCMFIHCCIPPISSKLRNVPIHASVDCKPLQCYAQIDGTSRGS